MDDYSVVLSNLKYTIEIVSAHNDKPILWKFNESYINTICNHLKLKNFDELMYRKILEIDVDFTTRDSYCVGLVSAYPLLK